MKAEAINAILNRARDWLGCHYDEAMGSLEVTERLLKDPNVLFRRGAMSLLAHYWEPQPRLDDTYRQLLESEADGEIRGSTVVCLTNLHSDTANGEVSQLLARIARDEHELKSARFLAYSGLFDVLGLCKDMHTVYQLAQWHDVPPEGLDWRVIDLVLRGDMDGAMGRRHGPDSRFNW